MNAQIFDVRSNANSQIIISTSDALNFSLITPLDAAKPPAGGKTMGVQQAKAMNGAASLRSPVKLGILV